MAFLDNSGDIILDAVLTDTGRLRMAQGDGSFKISKFALGDDEINYGLYNKDHLSGSAYYDLEVLQTPVLEAFTNNTSNLKTKLVTMSRTNVLYMPVLKVNPRAISGETSSKYFIRTEAAGATKTEDASAVTMPAPGKFYVAVDSTTFEGIYKYREDGTSDSIYHSDNDQVIPHGIIQGYTASPAEGGMIRVDHGLDTTEISVGQGLDTDLMENAFIVELDYRLGRIKLQSGTNIAPVNFIDDDNIATYYLAGSNWVDNGPSLTNTTLSAEQLALLGTNDPQVFGDGQGTGPRGNSFKFRIQASQELQQSSYLFQQLGTSQDLTSGGFGAGSVAGLPEADSAKDGYLWNLKDRKLWYLDSTVRVIGANTGYRIDIPIRFVKLT